MRELANADRIRRFMGALGTAADAEGAVYFTGGATAVLVGWRGSTIDVDVLFVPESDVLLRSLPELYRLRTIDPPSFLARARDLFRAS